MGRHLCLAFHLLKLPFHHLDGPQCIFNQLIFRKIITIVAARGHILKLKCTNFILDGASPQTPLGGAYSAPPDLLAGFKGAYF